MYALGFKLIDLYGEKEEGIYWLKKAAGTGD
jgi:hypothetical protein